MIGKPRNAKRKDPELGAVLDFLRLLWAIDHGLQRASKQMALRLGVTGPQRLVLRIIARFPDISAGGVAAALHVHPSTLTGVLQRLERERLIRRQADPRDGRRIRLSLTRRGRLLEAELEGTVESVVQRVLEQTSEIRLSATRVVLAVLARELEKMVADRSRTEDPKAAIGGEQEGARGGFAVPSFSGSMM